MKTLEFIVENQDILSDQMDKIIGGKQDPDQGDQCKSDGIIYNCTDGPSSVDELNAAFSIF